MILPADTITPNSEYQRLGALNWQYDYASCSLTIVNDVGMQEWKEFISGDNRYEALQIKKEIKFVTLKPGVSYIANNAFDDCLLLEEVILPEGLIEIHHAAFLGCGSLTAIELPQTVTRIDYNAFHDCYTLEELILPPKITFLATSVVAGCEKLKELRIPAAVTLISSYAIYGDGIQRIIFEGTVERIEHWYIHELPDLRYFVFLEGPPVSIEALERDRAGLQFSGDTPITIYYLNENKSQWIPNDETEWMGQPLVGIDSLDDLPPLN